MCTPSPLSLEVGEKLSSDLPTAANPGPCPSCTDVLDTREAGLFTLQSLRLLTTRGLFPSPWVCEQGHGQGGEAVVSARWGFQNERLGLCVIRAPENSCVSSNLEPRMPRCSEIEKNEALLSRPLRVGCPLILFSLISVPFLLSDVCNTFISLQHPRLLCVRLLLK